MSNSHLQIRLIDYEILSLSGEYSLILLQHVES